MGKNSKIALGKYGAIHLKQVLPQRLIKELRKQIKELLAINSKHLGIDRSAVVLHQQSPEKLRALHQAFCELPGLYEIALNPRIGELLTQ